MATKKEFIAQEVARAVGAGKAVAMETVDFSDPNRPKTCLEVDFPILPVNQVAVIEGNAGKPIYQMSKWWARRRSSVFRSMLIAAATKAPEDPSHAAKLVWDNYYANHQKKGAFKHLKVADIFMGGGTTLVEGSRLGMQMSGNDLNPVAWFVVKQELADIDLHEVKRLLADIEAEVKPQIMPFYYCDGPNGEKGTWTHKPSGKVMGVDFDPLVLKSDERKNYVYEGPEIIYTFWAKHGPCQVTGCGHRTPIMTSNVMAIKTLTVRHWPHKCRSCSEHFDIEDAEARMAPDVPLYVAQDEKPYSILDTKGRVICPLCGHTEMAKLDKGKNKKVDLSLLVHPEWLAGLPRKDEDGNEYGGSATDNYTATAKWNKDRAEQLRLVEVRGSLPDEVICPETKITFAAGKGGGTVPKKSTFTCQADGKANDVLDSIKLTKKTGPMAGYAVQSFSPKRKDANSPYGGRYFLPFNERLASQYNSAIAEWEARKNGDLLEYWPKSELPYGFMTHHLQGGVPNHGFTHWWTMFNPRQLLTLSLLLKAIVEVGEYSNAAREYVLGAFQNFLRNQNSLSFWHMTMDKLAPAMSNSNFHPKNNVIEVGIFPPMGYGPWSSTVEVLDKSHGWINNPWEIVSKENLENAGEDIAAEIFGKSEKVYPRDKSLGAEVFDAGFYLEATYPIRSDETKGEGEFGSKTIEYDIVHVCRKRTEEPKEVSWGRMRREVLADVRQLQGMLENHARAGLPAADLQVIRRGKALEYFSQHYGKVYVDEGRPISVKDALVGINQLIDEDANKTAEPPPVTAEPITRQFLRIFDGKTELARDQMQKLLRGSGIAPDEFTSRGWANEEKKVFHLADPLDFARDWQGKHRRRLTADLDQALVLVGACYDGSGINASDTLKNDNFKPHPALKGLLEWLGKRAPNQPMRNASSRALSIYNAWAASNKDAVVQMSLFLED